MKNTVSSWVRLVNGKEQYYLDTVNAKDAIAAFATDDSGDAPIEVLIINAKDAEGRELTFSLWKSGAVQFHVSE